MRRAHPHLALALLLATAFLMPAVSVSACGSSTPAVRSSTLLPSPSPSLPGGTGAGAQSPTPVGTPSTISPTAATSPGPSSSSTTGAARPTDKEIRADIIKRLVAAPDLVGLTFGVAVHDRVVTLAGTVETKGQKRTAEHIAVTEPGIVKVVSYVRVAQASGY